MIVMTAASFKGGVGKTETVRNLAQAFASHHNLRVLAIDMDPTSMLSIGWGLSPIKTRLTVYHAMRKPELAHECVVNLRDNLDLLPASPDLSGAEAEFARDPFGQNRKLKNVLRTLSDEYDLALIDTAGDFNFLFVNAVTASTHVLIALESKWHAYTQLNQLFEVLTFAQNENEILQVCGIVLTFYDRRVKLTKAIEDKARGELGEYVLKTVIPHNVAITEAPIRGMSVIEYEPKSTGAQAYGELAKEILQRVEEN